jgi:pimeloyl-ACP methyl ester carboxylesterase
MADTPTVVELRVHGVSGTPPEALLNCPTEFLEQKAGDKSAGFYRRLEWIDDTASPPEEGKWRRVMEAYSWGGLTSGRASRAVWLLFLPFILIDLAHWMLPPAGRKLPAAISVALLRLIALSFTLTLMLAAAVAVMDVIVWQCAGLDYCSAGWGPLAFLGSLDRGIQVAVSALPLVVMIVFLWRLGSEEAVVKKSGPAPDATATEDEQPHDPTMEKGKAAKDPAANDPPPSPAVTEGEVPLEVDTFWNPDNSVLRLRACHVVAWTAGLAAVALAAPLRYAESPRTHAVTLGLLEVNGALLAVVVLATVWNQATARGGTSAEWLNEPLNILRWLSLVLLAASLIWIAVADITYPPAPTHLPGLRGAIYVLLGVQVVLLIALFVFTAWSLLGTKRTEVDDGYRMTLRGFTAPFVALTGWLIGGGLSVGVGLWTAQALGKAVLSTAAARCDTCNRARTLASPTESFDTRVRAVYSDAPLIVPPPYVWASVAILFLIVAVIAAGLYVWFRIIPKRTKEQLNGGKPPHQRGGVLTDYPGVKIDDAQLKLIAAGRFSKIDEKQISKTDAEQLAKIAKARAVASLTDVGARLLAGMALLAVAVSIAMAVLYLFIGRFDSVVDWSPAITNISVFIAASLATGLVLLVVQAFRNRQLRRVVAILWDVVTFWPRANHPLTPPSYGVRTVWDLRLRLATLRAKEKQVDPDRRVILVAHSQGTVIAAATLLQAKLDKEEYPLLTFGSPLRRLYGQNFPAYFGAEALQKLRTRQEQPDPRWINLWALTDPIGAWVFDTSFVFVATEGKKPDMADALKTVDCRLLDVRQENLEEGKYGPDPNGPICGHSGFWTRKEYTQAVDVLQATVLPKEIPIDTKATAPPMDQYV